MAFSRMEYRCEEGRVGVLFRHIETRRSNLQAAEGIALGWKKHPALAQRPLWGTTHKIGFVNHSWERHKA
jgi:hypothetical protein